MLAIARVIIVDASNLSTSPPELVQYLILEPSIKALLKGRHKSSKVLAFLPFNTVSLFESTGKGKMLAFNGMLSRFRSGMRTNSFRVHFLVTGCCSVELNIASSSIYDLSRLGFKLVESPSEADVLIVGGWINEQFEKRLRLAYDQMQEPKLVVALGACAISGTPYISESEKKTVAQIIPVDVFASGCPPSAEACIEALMELRRKVSPENDQRAILQSAMKTGSTQV